MAGDLGPRTRALSRPGLNRSISRDSATRGTSLASEPGSANATGCWLRLRRTMSSFVILRRKPKPRPTALRPWSPALLHRDSRARAVRDRDTQPPTRRGELSPENLHRERDSQIAQLSSPRRCQLSADSVFSGSCPAVSRCHPNALPSPAPPWRLRPRARPSQNFRLLHPIS